MAIPDVEGLLKAAVLGAAKDQLTDDLLAQAVAEEQASLVHKHLAAGYEQVGATPEEMRELMRANWHQNQALLLSNAAIIMMLTDVN
jgi:hypothetical protein